MVEPHEFAELVRTIAEDQQRQWMCGRRYPLEGYFGRHPQLREAREPLLDVIYNEVRLRNLIGDNVTVEEYLRRFPHLADELEPLFQVHSAMESAYPESTYSAAAVASRVELPRSINWPGSVQPIAIIDDALEASVVQRRPAGNGAERVGVIFYCRDAALGREPHEGLRLLRKMPSSGLAIAYQAMGADRKQMVALKLLLNGPYLGTPAWEQLKQRVAELSGMRHPHLAAIYGTGELAGLPYVSMEFADCGSLAQRLQLGPLPPEESLRLARQIAAGLSELHRHNLVHANLKPTNVLLSIDGAWKLSDMSWSAILPRVLNLGLLVDRPPEKRRLRELTRELVEGVRPPPHLAIVSGGQGWRMGDARYLAPEIMAPDYEGPTAAEDIYALGAIFYECLTGQPPFCGPTPGDTLRQSGTEPLPQNLHKFSLAPELEEFCLRCLAKQPAQRPGIEQCVAALDALSQGAARRDRD